MSGLLHFQSSIKYHHTPLPYVVAGRSAVDETDITERVYYRCRKGKTLLGHGRVQLELTKIINTPTTKTLAIPGLRTKKMAYLVVLCRLAYMSLEERFAKQYKD